MARSHWLRVRGTRLGRPVQARFRSGSGTPIPLPRRATRLAGLFYKRHAAQAVTCAASCRSGVSGSLSLPSRGFFSPFPHGTLRYRWSRLFSLGSWSTRIHAGFLVPRATQVPRHGGAALSATGLSPALARLSGRFACTALCRLRGSSPRGPTTPLMAVWAPPSSLAATGGISLDFSSRAT